MDSTTVFYMLPTCFLHVSYMYILLMGILETHNINYCYWELNGSIQLYLLLVNREY